MSFQKLVIKPEDKEPIAVLFNPNQLSFSKSACWRLVPIAERDNPDSVFLRGEPMTLEVELFFDTYAAGKDVREHTRKIYHLLTIQTHGKLHRPPICSLSWGKFDFDGAGWVLTRLDQKFTLFLENGWPARATLSCSFREWRSSEIEEKALGKLSADLEESHTVRRGDTLSGIAAEAYGDPAAWRAIAEANGIDDPRELLIGRTLRVPKLSHPRPVEG